MTPVAAVLSAFSLAAWGVAADQVNGGDSHLGGIAAIIAASAGMVSAIGAIIIGWRSKSGGGATDLEKELLMKLLEEQFKKKDGSS